MQNEVYGFFSAGLQYLFTCVSKEDLSQMLGGLEWILTFVILYELIIAVS